MQRASRPEWGKLGLIGFSDEHTAGLHWDPDTDKSWQCRLGSDDDIIFMIGVGHPFCSMHVCALVKWSGDLSWLLAGDCKDAFQRCVWQSEWLFLFCLLFALCMVSRKSLHVVCHHDSSKGWQEQQIDVEIVVGLCNEENVSNERKHIFREQVNCGRNNIMCHNGCIWSLLCVAFGFELFWQVSLDGSGNFKTLETFLRHHWCDVVDDSHQVRHQLLGSFHWFGPWEKDQAGPGRVRSLKSAACEHGKTRLRCALMKNKNSCSRTSRNFFCPVGGNTGMPKKKWLLVLAKIL